MRKTLESKPLVSVIMASFNEGPAMIGNSIESILNQTYDNFELLIFDDSTNKNTIAKIDKYKKDTRVNIYRFQTRVGFVKSLNKGLKLAKGKYIARMDGDDFSLPDRLEKEVFYLEEHKEISVVGGQINIIDEADNVTSFRKYPTDGLPLYLFSCVRNPLAHPTVMMRRDLIDKGFYYDENLKMSEDLDLWLRMLNADLRIANLPDTILNYRVSDSFLEKRSNKLQRKYMSDVRKKNFDQRHIFHSVLSNISGWIFIHVPSDMINRMYSKENQMEKRK